MSVWWQLIGTVTGLPLPSCLVFAFVVLNRLLSLCVAVTFRLASTQLRLFDLSTSSELDIGRLWDPSINPCGRLATSALFQLEDCVCGVCMVVWMNSKLMWVVWVRLFIVGSVCERACVYERACLREKEVLRTSCLVYVYTHSLNLMHSFCKTLHTFSLTKTHLALH